MAITTVSVSALTALDVSAALLLGALAWAIWSVTRKPSRSNIWGLAVTAVVLGLTTGFNIAWRMYIPELRSVLGHSLTAVASDQQFASMLSAATLAKLEAGKDSEAKSLLARQVADYYQKLKDAKTLTAPQQTMLEHIEELIGKSEVLRQKIAEQTKK